MVGPWPHRLDCVCEAEGKGRLDRAGMGRLLLKNRYRGIDAGRIDNICQDGGAGKTHPRNIHEPATGRAAAQDDARPRSLVGQGSPPMSLPEERSPHEVRGTHALRAKFGAEERQGGGTGDRD